MTPRHPAGADGALRVCLQTSAPVTARWKVVDCWTVVIGTKAPRAEDTAITVLNFAGAATVPMPGPPTPAVAIIRSPFAHAALQIDSTAAGMLGPPS